MFFEDILHNIIQTPCYIIIYDVVASISSVLFAVVLDLEVLDSSSYPTFLFTVEWNFYFMLHLFNRRYLGHSQKIFDINVQYECYRSKMSIKESNTPQYKP